MPFSPLQEPHSSSSHVSETPSYVPHDSPSSGIPHISYDTSMFSAPQPSDTAVIPAIKLSQSSTSNWNLFSSGIISPSIHTQTPQPQSPLTINNHDMLTRSKTGKSKLKVFVLHSEPTSTKQAEYDSLIQNGTWELITLPSDRKHIGYKWVFKVNKNAYGSINKLQAILAADGFHQ